MIKKIILANLICLASCSFSKTTDYVKLSDKISKPFIEEVKKKTGYLYLGGGGSFYSDVEGVIINFKSFEKKKLDDARIEFIHLQETLLDRYNNNEPIRPFLNIYPFRPENIQIGIIYDTEPRPLEDNYVDSVQMLMGDVCYSLIIDNKGNTKLIEESYEEAYKKVYGKELPPHRAKIIKDRYW